MPRTYQRHEIGLRPSKGPTNLARTAVVGIVLHWHGGGPIRGVDNVKAALRGWQADHMDRQGWADIAYQEAFDQDGNVYVLRGITTRSAANGDQVQNDKRGALLLILGPGEHPTTAMVQAVRRRIAAHREYFPNSRDIVGHLDVRPEPTACPGPVVMAAIKSRLFAPVPAKPAPTRGRDVDEAQVHLRHAKGRAKGPRAKAIRRTLGMLRRIPLLKRGRR
jgi:hypothetical protein